MSKSARLRAQRRMQAMRVTAEQAQQLNDGRTWFRMVTDLVDQPDVAAIYLYDEIGYWGVTAQDFVRDLMGLRVSTIIVHINSPGGEVWDGLAIYHALRDHPANIEVRVDGIAASAASFIAMAGDTIVMQRNAQMMIHDAIGFCYGNVSEMEKMVEVLDQASNNIADIYVQQAGGTVESWREAMRVETWYSGPEALAAGLCDEVNNADEETDEPAAVVPGEDADDLDGLMAKAYDLTVFAYRYAGREKAPAPPVSNEDTTEQPAAVETPAAPAAPVTEPDAPVEQPTDDTTSTPEAPATDEPEAPVTPAEPGPTDEWAAALSGLFTTAPSTVDDVLQSLLKEGNPA
ncbi:ATP-dependent Clp protease proteolytic subunit [Amycolatopsis sp., V23-08]|uniref:ATP-dependent Clp protease proteolytic subunit n=1 Tax=Amycolatopsis heterodermiae TaxID=3110235 RepID=A0ABU5RIH6_9PSEU|nr:head maturation protease, ClpP-related [Amycolatopsis sp., V23-08]MEA5366092.1 ATP-dependent Clp protease proteolytic subunit [Amycolatopsis sp., V23-08]